MRTIKRLWRNEAGQDYLEFILVFGLALFLAGVFATLTWWWWNQTISATAIHDGTEAAAVWNGGNLGRGYETTDRLLHAGLGGFAPDMATYIIGYAGSLRSVVGSIDYQYAAPFGLGTMRVRARSFLRRERFYPGPPDLWE